MKSFMQMNSVRLFPVKKTGHQWVFSQEFYSLATLTLMMLACFGSTFLSAKGL